MLSGLLRASTQSLPLASLAPATDSLVSSLRLCLRHNTGCGPRSPPRRSSLAGTSYLEGLEVASASDATDPRRQGPTTPPTHDGTNRVVRRRRPSIHEPHVDPATCPGGCATPLAERHQHAGAHSCEHLLSERQRASLNTIRYGATGAKHLGAPCAWGPTQRGAAPEQGLEGSSEEP